MANDLSGKVALVTGATSGIGLETAASLAGRGATVVLGCRNLDAARNVAVEIRRRFPGAQVDLGLPLNLISQQSVKDFASEVNKKYPKLHILVNNAGVSYMAKTFTEEGVGGIAQTNHLGAYTLTRLLEKKLLACKARVVTVASVMHRSTTINSAKAFLTDWRSGYYEHSKLANVLFAYELQRRLGPAGLQSAAVDPGGVRSGIWDSSPMFKKGWKRSLLDACYSPPSDGAKAVIHAATVPWEKDRRKVKNEPVPPSEDLRYYARGLFCNPLLTHMDAYKRGTFVDEFKAAVWGFVAVTTSLLDWPLRRMSGGLLLSGTAPVRSSAKSQDKKLAKELWDASAELAGLPVEPSVA